MKQIDMKYFMIFIAIFLVIFTFFIANTLSKQFAEKYTKEREEYFQKQRMKVVRDSIQADMKYRHDSIEIEYYKQHIKN